MTLYFWPRKVQFSPYWTIFNKLNILKSLVQITRAYRLKFSILFDINIQLFHVQYAKNYKDHPNLKFMWVYYGCSISTFKNSRIFIITFKLGSISCVIQEIGHVILTVVFGSIWWIIIKPKYLSTTLPASTKPFLLP